MMNKPFFLFDPDPEVLADIRNLLFKRGYNCLPSPPPSNGSVDAVLSHIFLSLGIPPHLKGYKFLRESVKLTMRSPDIVNSLTKGLYPQIAARFSSSPDKVERAMRHALSVAWQRGNPESLNDLLGAPFFNRNDKPTNGEFIAILADKLLLDAV